MDKTFHDMRNTNRFITVLTADRQLEHDLCPMNPIFIFTPLFLSRTDLIFFITPVPMSSKYSFPFKIPEKNVYAILISVMHAEFLASLKFLDFITPIIPAEEFIREHTHYLSSLAHSHVDFLLVA
jgi:hypothetical protein